MLTHAPLVAFLSTHNSGASLVFYRDVLRLKLVEDTPFALVFDAAGMDLRIQKVDNVQKSAVTALGWTVKDIEAVVDGLIENGVAFKHFAGLAQDTRGIWQSPGGAQVAWFHDPVGHLLSLTQMSPIAAV